MKYRFNLSFVDPSKNDNLLRGTILYSNSEDFEDIVREFKSKFPNCTLKGIVVTEN